MHSLEGNGMLDINLPKMENFVFLHSYYRIQKNGVENRVGEHTPGIVSVMDNNEKKL